MFGLGTILNVAAIIFGGLLGSLCGKLLKPAHQDALSKACGVSILFIGIGGVLEGTLAVSGDKVVSGNSLLIIAALAIGALIGELLNIEGAFEKFGAWLRDKTGNAKDSRFINGFVTASLTVSIGAMAIVGAIEDGLTGDCSILATKAVLDLIIILVMTSSMGKGCIFSAIPVGLLQGSITALAVVMKPLITQAAMENLSMVGNILIFCVGINLIWEKKIRVANLLPALIIAAAAAFIPISL